MTSKSYFSYTILLLRIERADLPNPQQQNIIVTVTIKDQMIIEVILMIPIMKINENIMNKIVTDTVRPTIIAKYFSPFVELVLVPAG